MSMNGTAESKKQMIIHFFKGLLIGIANIIPGVSGGTFALILGIYERLLAALHAFDMESLQLLFAFLKQPFGGGGRQSLKTLLKRIDAFFLAALGGGAAVAILGLSFLIDWLLTYHPALTLSFFIGLIIPSIAVPWKMMGARRSAAALLWILPGVALTIAVSLAFGNISQAGDNLLWCFTTGAIAISAMILPGISGSFVMLVMGQYQNILKKIQSLQLHLASGKIDFASIIWLGTFAIGCVVGLIVFSRFLGFLLKRYRVATLAFLIGLIIGSFWILWPFKDYDYTVDLSHVEEQFKEKVAEKQDIRVATAPNKLPDSFSEVALNVLSLGIGLAGALGMNKFGGEEF